MECTAKVEELSGRLDQLAAELAGGAHQRLPDHVAVVTSYAAALEELLEAMRRGPVRMEAAALCREIRAKIGLIREMLAHAQQVSTGLASILALFYGAHQGAQYSARGAPAWDHLPRIWEEA